MPDAIFTEEQRREWVERQMMKDGVIPPRQRCMCRRCQLATLLPMMQDEKT